MPPRSDSRTESLIREWLFRFGVNFQRDVAPCLPLWIETFGEMDHDVLLPLFQRAVRSCKFFPTVADILAPLDLAENSRGEDEWQNVLEYCRRFVNRDLGMAGRPKLPPDVDHAARAAGSLYYLESCSTDDLQWAKKRFIEDLARQRKTGDIASFLPCSELRGILKAAASRLALPNAAAPARCIEHDEAFPRPLLQNVERAASLAATIRQGESRWAASQPGQKPSLKTDTTSGLGSRKLRDGYAKTKRTDSAAVSGSHRK